MSKPRRVCFRSSQLISLFSVATRSRKERKKEGKFTSRLKRERERENCVSAREKERERERERKRQRNGSFAHRIIRRGKRERKRNGRTLFFALSFISCPVVQSLKLDNGKVRFSSPLTIAFTQYVLKSFKVLLQII